MRCWTGWAAGILAISACEAAESQAAESQAAESQVMVRTAEVETASLRDELALLGTVRAAQTVEIRAQTPGTVEHVGYAAGEDVESGQVLFVVEGEQAQQQVQAQQAALQDARSRLRQAERTLQRHRALLEDDAIALAEFEESEAQVEQLRATVSRLEAELAAATAEHRFTQLRAPAAGRVTESHVEAGDYVSAGQLLATLHGTTQLEVVSAVPERYAQRVRTGLRVEATSEVRPDQVLEGEVHSVSPAIDAETRDLEIRATLDATEDLIPAGASVRLRLILEQRPERPLVPERALVGTREGYAIYVVEEDRARLRLVDVGVRRPGEVEILEGVAAGEEIVVEGQIRLLDDTPIRRVDPADAAAGADAPP